MIITIDLNNPKPTYLQIVDNIRRAIANGSLKPGDKLPTIRDAAVQARVNRNTVSRAYLELEHMGLVFSRQGSGCFVAEADLTTRKQERLKLLERLTDELVLEAHHHQISLDEVVELVQKSASKLGKEQA